MERAAKTGPSEQAEWERQHAVAATELVIGLVGAVGTDLRGVSDEIGLALDEFGYETTQIGLSNLLHELDWQVPLAAPKCCAKSAVPSVRRAESSR